MHMADALLSPAVGGTMWALSAGAIACCSYKLGVDIEDDKIPLMGVLGAFVFAAQMINFSIPGTGSSGHLGGGLLLCILLGPAPAFLTIASVLVVQALFFADGGLLALGCNIFNLGFIPAFLVFPLLYGRLIGSNPGRSRRSFLTVLSAVIALQLGALAVVIETACSGISALPVSAFLLLMQPIHLAIGLVEGIVTIAVVSFLMKARPGMLKGETASVPANGGKAIFAILLAAIIVAGVFSSYASREPDGLEWAIGRINGGAALKAPEQGPRRSLARLQEQSALLSGYALPAAPGAAAVTKPVEKGGASGNTGIAGIVGSMLTLLLVFFAGFVIRMRRKRKSRDVESAVV